MKIKILAQTGVAIAISAAATINLPSAAQQPRTTFFCGSSNGVPTTFARTQRGNLPMIRWISTAFPPPWTPTRRCQEVSNRFQRYADNGTLKYLKTGMVNRKPVICATPSKSGICNSNNVLFTVGEKNNPNVTLGRLLDQRGLATGRTVNETLPSYVDVDEYLKKVPVEENISPINDPEVRPPKVEENRTKPGDNSFWGAP